MTSLFCSLSKWLFPELKGLDLASLIAMHAVLKLCSG